MLSRQQASFKKRDSSSTTESSSSQQQHEFRIMLAAFHTAQSEDASASVRVPLPPNWLPS